MQNLQYAVYKGVKGKYGAVQWNLQNPHYYREKQKDFSGSQALDETGKLREGWKIREGAVFMEITSAKEANVYDWENKITVALSTNDLGKVLYGLKMGTEIKLMHDPGAKSDAAGTIQKHVNISSPNGTAEGCMIRVTQIKGGVNTSHMVPLSGDELVVLSTLVQAAIARSLGW